MSSLRRRCPLGFHAHRDEVASLVLCPWGGGVFDLSEAGFAARAIACCFARDALVYIACRGRVAASFNRGCPSVRCLDGRMMSEVVSV
ncbi:hypothetical protein CDL15_Pgr005067 [Punica granatum]|uniref:Uncharacterized protein n=1 Tax=Punica granatum TaxID=22663 RepID=A0A218XZP6_PUNGR|nr:hypothetical protein CDL15_Pgr005067 [Punica granatum]